LAVPVVVVLVVCVNVNASVAPLVLTAAGLDKVIAPVAGLKLMTVSLTNEVLFVVSVMMSPIWIFPIKLAAAMLTVTKAAAPAAKAVVDGVVAIVEWTNVNVCPVVVVVD